MINVHHVAAEQCVCESVERRWRTAIHTRLLLVEDGAVELCCAVIHAKSSSSSF